MFDLNDPEFLRFLQENGFVQANQNGVGGVPPVDASLAGNPLFTNSQGSPTGVTTQFPANREPVQPVSQLERRGVVLPDPLDSIETSRVPVNSVNQLQPSGITLDDSVSNIDPVDIEPNLGTAETSGVNVRRNTSFEDIPSSFLAGDIDLNTSTFKLGQSLAFNADEQFSSPEARKRAKRGNTTRLIGSAGKTLLNLARTGFSGAGFQNRLQTTLNSQQEKNRQGLIGNFQSGEDGMTVGDPTDPKKKKPATQNPNNKAPLTSAEVSSLNDVSGVQFTDEGANSLFERFEPAKLDPPPKFDVNLGKYGSLNYFDVVESNEGDIVLTNTARNPHNGSSIKQLIPKLRELNPGKNVRIDFTRKFQDGGEQPAISIEELMTGEFLTGLPSFSLEEPNAEIERDEYVMNPDDSVQKVVGKTHAGGGEKVILESGTKVVSNNLTIGGNNAKYFRKQYDLDVKAGDTYATVVDKYTKNLGLDKINEEQVGYFQKLKEQEEVDDLATVSLNTQFLSGKIKEKEDQKKPLEQSRSLLFEDVFNRQEASKSTKADVEVPIFKDGGSFTSKDFQALIKRHGLNEDQAIKLVQELKKGGIIKRVPKYANGDEVGDPTDPKKPFIRKKNTFNDSSTFVHQSRSARGFGNVNDENFLERINNLREGFPLIVENTFDFQLDDQGNIVNAELKAGRTIEDFQKEVDNNYELLINETSARIENPEQRQNFIEQVEAERFNNQVARGFDNKFGNFTSSRPNFGFELITPEDFTKLQEQGITSFKELLDDNGNIDPSLELSDKSKENLGKFVGTNANFLIGEIAANQTGNITPVDTPAGPGTDDAITVNETVGRFGNLPFLPDQSVLPPDSLEPHLKITRRFDRIDPVAVSPEENLVELARNETAVADQLNALPTSQRTAALTNLSANTQRGANQAITEANRINAQNEFTADQINLQQSNAEENARANDLLDFERRQLTAKAKTVADLNNFFDFNRRVRLGNFNTLNRFDQLNTLFENFETTPFGTVRRNDTEVTLNSPFPQNTSDAIEYGNINVFTNKKTTNKKS